MCQILKRYNIFNNETNQFTILVIKYFADVKRRISKNLNDFKSVEKF